MNDALKKYGDLLTNDQKVLACLGTVMPSGAPQVTPVWFDFDGKYFRVNSAKGRVKDRNMRRNPAVSLAIVDRNDGLRWIGLTSTARPVTDQPTAQADIAGMARRYHADEPEEGERIIRDRFERQERISFRLPIGDLHEHLD